MWGGGDRVVWHLYWLIIALELTEMYCLGNASLLTPTVTHYDSWDDNIILHYNVFFLLSFVISFSKLWIFFLPLSFFYQVPPIWAPASLLKARDFPHCRAPILLLCLMAFYSYVKVNKAHVGIQATKHTVMNLLEMTICVCLFLSSK